MKNMTKTMYNRLRPGLKSQGRSMDAYWYVEENLYCDEAETIFEFTKWIVENEIGVGPANISERCKEFNKYIKENPPVEEEKEEAVFNEEGKMEIAPGVFVEVMTLSMG